MIVALICGCNKIDRNTTDYKQADKKAKYSEASNKMKSMLVTVGWKKDMFEQHVRERRYRMRGDCDGDVDRKRQAPSLSSDVLRPPGSHVLPSQHQ